MLIYILSPTLIFVMNNRDYGQMVADREVFGLSDFNTIANPFSTLSHEFRRSVASPLGFSLLLEPFVTLGAVGPAAVFLPKESVDRLRDVVTTLVTVIFISKVYRKQLEAFQPKNVI